MKTQSSSMRTKGLRTSDWMITVFLKTFSVDAFASAPNAICFVFFSCFDSNGTSGVDFFNQCLFPFEYYYYLFPPISKGRLQKNKYYILGTLSLKGGGLGPMVDCPYPYFDFFKLKQIIHNP